jgi:two-component system sensor histidine kinase KdpD
MDTATPRRTLSAMRSTPIDKGGPQSKRGLPVEGADPLAQALEAGGSAPEIAGTAGPGQGQKKGRDPLLAAICHDLRAPLAAVMMGTNFILSTTPKDEASSRSRCVLEAMLRSCKQMDRLVRDLGDLSEIEAGAVVLRTGVHDAREMVEIAAEAARPAAAARSVELVVSGSDAPVVLRCDRERILRALAHLLDNATHFAPEGSAIELAVREHDGEVRLSVTDRGAGLSADTLEHLYDRTWHSKRAERTGAGLGLGIVRGFVEAHGGRVEVDPTPGATMFTLVLPKVVRPEQAEEDATGT